MHKASDSHTEKLSVNITLKNDRAESSKWHSQFLQRENLDKKFIPGRFSVFKTMKTHYKGLNMGVEKSLLASPHEIPNGDIQSREKKWCQYNMQIKLFIYSIDIFKYSRL